MPSATPTEPESLVLRPAAPLDAVAVADVHLSARRAAVAAGHMPPGVHPDPEVRAWLAERVERDETWVAELAGEVVGYLRLVADWLDDLYVAPAHSRCGVGSALVGLAQGLRPDGFGLYVFAMNLPARRLYAAHGFVETDHHDPLANEEGVADVRLVWTAGSAQALSVSPGSIVGGGDVG